MVDAEKVKVMTKIAIYEKGDGKKEIPISKYYKRDYVKYNILKTMVFATISYWLIVGVAIAVNLEEILSKINNINYMAVVYMLFGGYVAFLFLYTLITKLVYGARYEKARPKLIIYNYLLKKLIKFYDQSEKGTYAMMPKDMKIEDGGEEKADDNITKY